jgi:hypothetical protein
MRLSAAAHIRARQKSLHRDATPTLLFRTVDALSTINREAAFQQRQAAVAVRIDDSAPAEALRSDFTPGRSPARVEGRRSGHARGYGEDARAAVTVAQRGKPAPETATAALQLP